VSGRFRFASFVSLTFNHPANFNNPLFTRFFAPASLHFMAAAISGNVKPPKNRSRNASACASGSRLNSSWMRWQLSWVKS
jgi:hypothetical protein